MFDMDCDQTKELWKEADAKEKLCRSIHAPVKQVHQMNDSVGWEHVVSVLSKGTK